MTRIQWSDEVADRAAGVLLGQAFGDALGAPYEFGPPLGGDVPVDLVGGGPFGWAPGEWTDDTQMAVAVLETAEQAARDGVRLVDRLDALVTRWIEWSSTAADVGAQTRAVLGAVAHSPTADAARAAADALHARSGRSGGNGSLMRTAPVALVHLDDVEELARAAREVSSLTHHDPEAGDACVLWCAAIRHAVLTGEADARVGLDLLPPERRAAWGARLTDAEQRGPSSFTANGWVVEALGSAWSAVSRTPGHGPGYVRSALESTVRGGKDTDTVAAIAGALVGARSGAAAVRAALWAPVHGWPGLTGEDLARRGRALAAPR